ncbi:tripartite tricarboxylate transporter substrate binding protein [Bradyrhizobium sp.]|uniref:Bug family tripartite tricarboxylate transporter substrate binding protein n=1 Tax=Bradyrhizobium sp. TaxID=376 RepID=UPI0023919DC5|nr:tripartite tricarboxylate transporter substrate-binding protein [Bradyrhizobium sp.]MDE1933792.1 hypothetical protein [Bradyrhizobium sp.]
MGTPFVVENVPGAGSNIATAQVAKAPADGYTRLMGSNSSLVINPTLYDTLPFDPVKDFAPISQVFIAANVLAVPSELPIKSVAERTCHRSAESRARPSSGEPSHLLSDSS